MYREHFLTTEKFQKDSGSARTQSDIFPICRHFLHCHTPSTKCGGAPKTFVTLSHVTHRDKEIPYDEGAKCHEILGRFISVMDWVESYLARGIETYVTLLGCRCLTFSLELQKIHQCHLPKIENLGIRDFSVKILLFSYGPPVTFVFFRIRYGAVEEYLCIRIIPKLFS